MTVSADGASRETPAGVGMDNAGICIFLLGALPFSLVVGVVADDEGAASTGNMGKKVGVASLLVSVVVTMARGGVTDTLPLLLLLPLLVLLLLLLFILLLLIMLVLMAAVLVFCMLWYWVSRMTDGRGVAERETDRDVGAQI